MHYILTAGKDGEDPEHLGAYNTVEEAADAADDEFALMPEQYSTLFTQYYCRLNDLEQGANWARITACDCHN